MIRARIAKLDAGGHRTAARRLVNFGARVESDRSGASIEVVVVDLSRDGCKIICSDDLPAGTSLWLKLPDQEARRMHVVWSGAGEAGCEFATPFSGAELEACRAVPPVAAARRRTAFGLRG